MPSEQVANGAAATLGPPAIDPTQENAALLLAIHQIVVADGPEARARLYQTVLSATLYLVTLNNEGEESGPLELTQGGQLQLATIRSPEGETFLPAFTDVPRLSVTLPPKGRYVPVPVQMICQMLLQGDGQGIVINPRFVLRCTPPAARIDVLSSF